MRYIPNRLFVFVLGCLAILASGCGDLEARLSHADDPKQGAGIYGAMLLTTVFISFFFGHGSVTNHLHRALKWSSCVAIAASPIYWQTTHDPSAGIAAAATGLIGIGLTMTVLRDWGLPTSNRSGNPGTSTSSNDTDV